MTAKKGFPARGKLGLVEGSPDLVDMDLEEEEEDDTSGIGLWADLFSKVASTFQTSD